LYLVDMTSPRSEEQIQVIEEVLQEIGAGTIPSILVPNKIDLVSDSPLQQFKRRAVEGIAPISALTGAGVDCLLELIGKVLDRGKEQFHARFFSGQGKLLSLLRESGTILEETYHGDEVHVTALVTPKLAGQMRKLLDAAGRQNHAEP
jgi:GTP-binding protein HflX